MQDVTGAQSACASCTYLPKTTGICDSVVRRRQHSGVLSHSVEIDTSSSSSLGCLAMLTTFELQVTDSSGPQCTADKPKESCMG